MESDHTQSLEIAANLRDVTDKFYGLSKDAGVSRQVVKFTTNTRDNIIAKYTKPYLERGFSVAKAEIYARNEEGYQREIEQLMDQDREAEKILTEWETLKIVIESGRSLLSHAKGIREDLQG